MRDDGRREYYGRGPEEVRRRMEEVPARRGGMFAGNRSLLIIFIDIVIILIIYGLYVTFLAGPTSVRTIDGYRFSLSASPLESSALATLRISAGEAAEAEDPIVTVRFRDAGDGRGDAGDGRGDADDRRGDADDRREDADEGGAALGNGSTVEVKDVLPDREGQERVFRRRVRLREDQELIRVEVDALGESFTLEASAGLQ